MKEPFWLKKEAVLAMHDAQLARHGGLEGIRNEGGLESALNRAQNLFYYSDKTVDIAAMAAAYAYGLATNHPFSDGNKRTALVASLTFLNFNKKDINVPLEDAYITFYRLAAGEISEDELTAWFRKNLIDS